jgi:hypothetical protein
MNECNAYHIDYLELMGILLLIQTAISYYYPKSENNVERTTMNHRRTAYHSLRTNSV